MGDYGAADEIAKLAELKERGLLSDDEFEEQRKRILEGTKAGTTGRPQVLVVVGIVVVLVALTVGLLEGTSSGPSKNSSGDKTVHLSLASETSPEAAAVNWAKSMVNNPAGRSGAKYWYGCLAFAFDAWGIGAGHSIRGEVTVPITSNSYPSDIWGHFSGGTTGTDSNPPAGALVFWNSKGGRDDSHVAISIGGGELISTNVDQPAVSGYNGIHEESMSQFASNSWNLYDGWWLPDGSNSPPPSAVAAPAPTTTSTTAAVHVSSGGGSVGGSSVQPAGGGSSVQPAGGGSSLQPASGGSSTSRGSGSSAAATTTPTPAPTTAPTSPPPPPPQTYAETVGGVSHTWTNYTNAGGTEGPSIAAYQTVQIACKVTGFKVSDGNTWWYRIASSPWNNQYYVSADAFYNNGETSGSLSGTPFVDPAVPNC